MQNRYAFIDGLRGIAAVAVMAFHALRGGHLDITIIPRELVSLVTLGEAGVVIFFVISGFVITNSLSKTNLGPGGVLPFILFRSLRLDPPYWVALALTIGFSTLASAIVPDRPPTEYSAGLLFAHVFYVQEILGYSHVNLVFWTLCLEIQFYIVLAMMLAMRSDRLLILIFAASLLWPLEWAPPVRGLFVNLFYSFLLGVGAYYALNRPAVRPWFFAYAMIVVLASVDKANLVGIISAAMAVSLLCVALAGKLSTLLNWQWLQFLGMISYSLYLTHNPITGAVFRVWYMMAGRSSASQVIGLALAIGACILFAWGMYKLVERPCIMLAKSVAKKELPRSMGLGRRGKPAEPQVLPLT